jgi:hypothetical protein
MSIAMSLAKIREVQARLKSLGDELRRDDVSPPPPPPVPLTMALFALGLELGRRARARAEERRSRTPR